MANKSRKRIKHEQRVRIAALERQLESLRKNEVQYEQIEVTAKCIIHPDSDPIRYNAVLEMESERAVRNMAEQLIHHGAVERVEMRVFDPRWGVIRGYEFKLKALKRRF